MTECEALAIQQKEILENKHPTPDASWSLKKLVHFFHLPQVHQLMTSEIPYEERETIFMEHNYTDAEDMD